MARAPLTGTAGVWGLWRRWHLWQRETSGHELASTLKMERGYGPTFTPCTEPCRIRGWCWLFVSSIVCCMVLWRLLLSIWHHYYISEVYLVMFSSRRWSLLLSLKPACFYFSSRKKKERHKIRRKSKKFYKDKKKKVCYIFNHPWIVSCIHFCNNFLFFRFLEPEIFRNRVR